MSSWFQRNGTRATLTTVCTVGGKPVIEGEASVMVASRPA